MTGFCDEHEPMWYPVSFEMPEVFPVVTELMERVQAKRLGGVLITRVPPGGRIDPHVDHGWHAEYYDKYYVPILNNSGATFNFPDGAIAPKDGEVYWFRNDVPHWVINDSQTDRIAMIVCIEPNDRFSNEHRNRPVQRTGGDL
jgi:aspartyl/asparaginyl beta-hydroxylase (cupin superfamily)